MGLVFRLVVLGLVPMTVIISLNCCIYWAVRRARIQRSVQYSAVQYSTVQYCCIYWAVRRARIQRYAPT